MSLRVSHPRLARQFVGGLSIADLALAYDCTPKTIRKHLRLAGAVLPEAKRGARPKIADRAELVRLRAEGLTFAEIGRRHGVSHTAARKIVINLTTQEA